MERSGEADLRLKRSGSAGPAVGAPRTPPEGFGIYTYDYADVDF